MLNVHRHNPLLRARLKPLVEEGDAVRLLAVLQGLSNSEFRTAGYLLAEDLLPKIASSHIFLSLFFHIVPTNPKAYLGTFLKAARQLYESRCLDLFDVRWENYAIKASGIDRRKIMDALLPVVCKTGEVIRLLELFTDGTVESSLPHLLKAGTTESYFQLFRNLRQIEENELIIKQQYFQLVKKGDKRSFNMACILRCYFDLGDLPGEFSLSIEPYQLSRLDLTFETFSKTLNK